jgi:C4-dicarboxylate-specific signal transduction histidine kinase
MQAGERAADLTRQLPAYSGKGRVVLDRLDVSRVVRGMRDLLQATIPRMARLELELAEGLPEIEADPGQVQQVAMNLVINGAEAVGERPGVVTIQTGWQDLDESSAARDGYGGELRPGRYVYLR